MPLNNIYENYLLSTYGRVNRLNLAEYENSATEFDAYYSAILPQEKNVEILDVGCGTGHFLYYLERKGYENCAGVDISAQQKNFARRSVNSKITVMDVFDFLKVQKKYFDLIFAHDFMEHIAHSQILEFLNLVYGKLKAGGILVLRVPNMSNPFSLDSRYRDFTHVSGFTDKSLYQVLYTAGFKEIEIISSKIIKASWKTIVRKQCVRILHFLIKFLFYIQDYSSPKHLGKNLIAISKK
jgi:cyclopropane fatty-acyl-phospholipid synthase-like methyltransferase